MAKRNDGTALTLADRQCIEQGIRKGATKTAIACTVGKDKSTIGKEIRLHRFLSSKSPLARPCAAYKHCKHKRACMPDCSDFTEFICKRRDRSPGACTGCSSRSSCRFDKYDYKADTAHAEYKETLVDSRSGVNLTTSEAKQMASVIKPLLDQGLSPYQIITSHPELGICEKTLYNYIDQHVFDVVGIKNIDLRRKVSRRMPAKKAKSYKKREDRAYLKGRTQADYQKYIDENPMATVLQMDTVYNDVSNGPFIQTFKFISCSIMVGVFHDNEKNASGMTNGLTFLDNALGHVVFQKYAQVLKTDRGSEFTDAEGMEIRQDGTVRTRVFYCDPMQSGQKGSLEVNHELLRYICPKETDLKGLGLINQDALNCVMSNIASAPLESLNGKSPIQYTKFMAPDLWEGLEKLGLYEVPADEIILKPYLLKQFL